MNTTTNLNLTATIEIDTDLVDEYATHDDTVLAAIAYSPLADLPAGATYTITRIYEHSDEIEYTIHTPAHLLDDVLAAIDLTIDDFLVE